MRRFISALYLPPQHRRARKLHPIWTARRSASRSWWRDDPTICPLARSIATSAPPEFRASAKKRRNTSSWYRSESGCCAQMRGSDATPNRSDQSSARNGRSSRSGPTRVGCRSNRRWSVSIRESIEKLDHTGTETILGTNYQQPVAVGQTLEDRRPVPEMIRRGADVRAHSLGDQRRRLLAERRGQQRLHRGPNPVDNGPQTGRGMRRRLTELLDGRGDRATFGVAEHDDQLRAEARGGEFYAADLRRRHDIPGHPDDEQVAKSLCENELGGNARVRTAEDDGKGCLAVREGEGTGAAERGGWVRDARDELAIARPQTRQGCHRRHHGWRAPSGTRPPRKRAVQRSRSLALSTLSSAMISRANSTSPNPVAVIKPRSRTAGAST